MIVTSSTRPARGRSRCSQTWDRVFPNARIIYVRRDPTDTCLSCYFQQFATQGFTTDLEDLAHYYRSHRRLVDHWRAALPVGRS